jgi:hypothetical protein
MDYQLLYNIIGSKLKDTISKYGEEYYFNLLVNTYLVALGFRTAHYATINPENLQDLDFIEYVKISKKMRNKGFYYFIVNKDFYKSNGELFENLRKNKPEDRDNMDLLLGKILNYPCVGKLDEINSKKNIGIEYIIKKDSLETQLFAYICPYDIKEKSLFEAENYLKKIQEVLSFVDVKARIETEEREAESTNDIENKIKIYNTIGSNVSEEQKNNLNMIVNIYLVATGIRTSYLTSESSQRSVNSSPCEFIIAVTKAWKEALVGAIPSCDL